MQSQIALMGDMNFGSILYTSEVKKNNDNSLKNS